MNNNNLSLGQHVKKNVDRIDEQKKKTKTSSINKPQQQERDGDTVGKEMR